MRRRRQGELRQPPGSFRDDFVEAEELVERLLDKDRTIDLLEAGCGYHTYFRFKRRLHTTGVDVSEDALRAHPNLDAWAVADLENFDIGSDRFDAALCWNVLEHLDRPERALANIHRALRPTAVLVLGLPNVLSIKGMTAKLTPHRFHVWFYRVAGWSGSGPHEEAPYPTKLKLGLRRRALVNHLQSTGWDVRYVREYESRLQKGLRYRIGLTGWKWAVVRALCRIASLAAIDATHTDTIIVARKR